MSDIYFRQERDTIKPSSVATFFNFTSQDWHKDEYNKNLYIHLCRNDDMKLWAPTINQDGQSLYIAGRTTFHQSDWEKAEKLAGKDKTGLASGYLLSIFKQGGFLSLTNYLNGAHGIVIKDQQNSVYVITDRMGFFPLYYAHTEQLTIVSSHPDIIAKDKAISDIDLTSIGEYLTYGKVEHPNTYYTHIKQLAPGSIYKFELNKEPQLLHQYFCPEFKWQKESPKELIKQLHSSLYEAVQDRSNPILGKSGVFLSGGMDSRSILASGVRPDEMLAATFYDEVNDELNTAKTIANRYGAAHLPLQRHFEYYIENASLSAKLMAGQWNVLDAHYTGFIEKILSTNVQNWLTGCFADWMFKGLASNTKYLTLMGKVIPTIKRLDSFNKVFFQPKFDIANTTLNQEIEERKNNIYSNLHQLNGESFNWNIEKIRLFPINRESTMGTRHILSRTLRWDPVLADNRLIEVFQKLPVSYKLKHNIWGNAVAKICKGHNDIKDNNWGARIDAGEIEKITSFIIKNIKRKIKKTSQKNESITTVGSWPNFFYLTHHSEMLPHIWSNINPNSFHIIEEITGINYSMQNHLDLAKHNMEYFYRLFTILLWLDGILKKDFDSVN